MVLETCLPDPDAKEASPDDTQSPSGNGTSSEAEMQVEVHESHLIFLCLKHLLIGCGRRPHHEGRSGESQEVQLCRT